MKLSSYALMLATASALPFASVSERADQCGQYETTTVAPYTLYTNLWGSSSATFGSQCSGIDSVNENGIAWHTTYTWAGSPYQSFDSIKTLWMWSYTGSSLVANVAYDMFTSSTADGNTEYEVMVWLGSLGGAGPLGSLSTTVSIGGYEWQLHKGMNGVTPVFSFVATTNQSSFTSDLLIFLEYLIQKQGLPATQYLKSVGAGTEPFLGNGADLKTLQYYVVPV